MVKWIIGINLTEKILYRCLQVSGLKKLLKSKEIGEDEEKSHEKKVQTVTDEHINTVDQKVSSKEKEIMTI